jgi:hypothetical protein
MPNSNAGIRQDASASRLARDPENHAATFDRPAGRSVRRETETLSTEVAAVLDAPTASASVAPTATALAAKLSRADAPVAPPIPRLRCFNQYATLNR